MDTKTTLPATKTDETPQHAALSEVQLSAAGALARRRIHSAIRRALSAAGIRQSQLASILGINKSSVSRMLASPNNLTIENAGRILRAANYWLDVVPRPIEHVGDHANMVTKAGSTGLSYRIIHDPTQTCLVVVTPKQPGSWVASDCLVGSNVKQVSRLNMIGAYEGSICSTVSAPSYGIRSMELV